jgi:hypothetical protein
LAHASQRVSRVTPFHPSDSDAGWLISLDRLSLRLFRKRHWSGRQGYRLDTDPLPQRNLFPAFFRSLVLSHPTSVASPTSPTVGSRVLYADTYRTHILTSFIYRYAFASGLRSRIVKRTSYFRLLPFSLWISFPVVYLSLPLSLTIPNLVSRLIVTAMQTNKHKRQKGRKKKNNIVA